jgi:hypothetical protein
LTERIGALCSIVVKDRSGGVAHASRAFGLVMALRSPIILFYVADIWTSAPFYSHLFGCAPNQTSPSFALFLLPSGMRLGLWSQSSVQPVPVTRAGGRAGVSG